MIRLGDSRIYISGDYWPNRVRYLYRVLRGPCDKRGVRTGLDRTEAREAVVAALCAGHHASFQTGTPFGA